MRTFAEVPRGGALNDNGVVEVRNFHRLFNTGYIFKCASD